MKYIVRTQEEFEDVWAKWKPGDMVTMVTTDEPQARKIVFVGWEPKPDQEEWSGCCC